MNNLVLDTDDDADFVEPPRWKKDKKRLTKKPEKPRKRPRTTTTKHIPEPPLKISRASDASNDEAVIEVIDIEDDEVEPVLDELLACVPDDVGDDSRGGDEMEVDEVEVSEGGGSVERRSDERRSTDGGEIFGECPICGRRYYQSKLEMHASSCNEQKDDRIKVGFDEDDQFQVSVTEVKRRELTVWLKERGMGKYVTKFWLAGYTSVQKLQSIQSEEILKDRCGVRAIGPRRKLCMELGIVEGGKITKPKPIVPSALPRLSGNIKTDEKEKTECLEDQHGKRMWKIFEKGYKAPVLPVKRKNSYQNPDQYKPKQHPWNHRIPGTSMVLDSFRAAGTDACQQYFISHAHGDHYQSLRKDFKHGKVLCSAVTAKLLQIILRVPETILEILPMYTPIDIPDAVMKKNGVTVTLFDANHCPGAVLMLFRVWSTGRYVLHTGDCRFSLPIFSLHEPLQALATSRTLDFLFLDTTYCNPKYTFPLQKDVLSSLAKQAQVENMRTRGRCLFIFGSYTIGKEKCFLKVAEALDLKIYCDSYKRRLLKASNFGDRITSRLVTSPMAARVHVTTMRSLGIDGLKGYINKHKLSRLLTKGGLAVIVRPTGWTFKGGTSEGLMRRIRSDNAVQIDLAYSEHSSFNELRDFVQWMNPKQIVPTVNVRSKSDADRLRGLLR